MSVVVDPMDNPVVVNAVSVSKNTSLIKRYESLADIMSAPVNTTISAKAATAIARKPVLMFMLCLNIIISSLPRRPDTAIQKSRANVVVFIPPPVPPGDEPINIRMHVYITPAGDSLV